MKTTLKILPLVALLSSAFNVQSQQIAFSETLLRSMLPPGHDVDMTQFMRGLEMPPGVYDFELRINEDKYQSRPVEVRAKNGKLEPVFKVADLLALPFKEHVLEKLKDKSLETELFPLSEYFDHLTTTVDVPSQTIVLSVPQIYLNEKHTWSDVAPQALWDSGEPGAMLNYNISGSHITGRHGDNSTHSNVYANLNGQINYGPWRLYSSGTLYANKYKNAGFSRTEHQWDLWNTYLQRDVNQVKGTLQFGEINTSGEIFDSISMRGIRLTSNEMMLPRADREYSPIIEGVALSNAQIFIKQNNRIVYMTNVAPGPFKLDSLPTFGSEGDLEVVIRESDGTERIMIVPYSSIPMMLKAGQWRYDFNVGRYFHHNMTPGTDSKFFTMGTLAYGLPNDMTVYGGAITGEKYLGLALGLGLSLGRYGALSVDATQSKAFKDADNGIDKDFSGTAWRVRYEKTMLDTGTTVHLANYHYLTGNYRSFEEIAENESRHYLPYDSSIKSSWQLAISQTLRQFGSLSAGMTYTSYKGHLPDSKSINLNYSTSVKGVGVYLGYGRNYEQRENSGWLSSHSLMLNLHIPLDLVFGNTSSSVINRTDVQYQGSMYRDINGDDSYRQRAIVNGHSDDNTWNWSLSQTMGNSENRESSVRVGYSGSDFGGELSYSYSKWSHSYNGGLNGSLVIHQGGVTPSRYANNSVALIEVPNVSGVKLTNSFDTKTDANGFAVLPYLTNYSRNEIAIDPSTLPEGALLLDNTNKIVYPTAGAIVKVKYPVRFGHHALFYLTHNDKPLPFGTQVVLIDEDGKRDTLVQGMVGQSGRVYLTALPQSGHLQAVMNDNTSVDFHYQIPTPQDLSNKGFVPIPKLYIDSVNEATR